MDFDTSQLRAFVTVAELQSFTKASERLCRVQSAISQQIQKLEKQIDTVLFIRNRSGVKLTAQGEALLPYAVKILAVNNEAMAALCNNQQRGWLRVGTSDTYAPCFLAEILMICCKHYPSLQIEVHCGYSGHLWSMYEKGQLDVVLTQCCPSHISSETLHIEPLLWMCSRTSEIYKKPSVPLAVFSEGCADRDIALNAMVKAGKDFTVTFHSTSHAGILAAVSSGCFVSPLLASTSNRDFKILTEKEGFPLLGNLEIALAYNDHAVQSSDQMFANVVRDYFRWFNNSLGGVQYSVDGRQKHGANQSAW